MATLKLKSKGTPSATERAPLSVPVLDDDPVSREHFWFVWNFKKRAPEKRHTTAELAIAEAARLATQHPSHEFMVFEATRVHTELESNTQGQRR
jgi:hypothetical protein